MEEEKEYEIVLTSTVLSTTPRTVVYENNRYICDCDYYRNLVPTIRRTFLKRLALRAIIADVAKGRHFR